MKCSQSSFTRWAHNFGQISGAVIILMMLASPVVLCAAFDIWPDLSLIIPGILTLVVMMAPFCVAESIAYPPIMGPGAVYMAYITGNTSAFKMPCTLAALQISGVKQGTDEGNAIALISVGTSTLMVTFVIFLCTILVKPLYPILTSQALAPSLNNVTPAVLGALLGGSILGKFKYYCLPLLISVILFKFTPIPSPFILLISLAGAIISGYVITNRQMRQAAAVEAENTAEMIAENENAG